MNLIDYCRVVSRHRWMILCTAILACMVFGIPSLRSPRVYVATASIMSPMDMLQQQQGSLASRLSGAGPSLLQGMFSGANASAQYIGILKSRVVADSMIDRFDLMNVYEGVATRSDTRQRLGQNTAITTSREKMVYIAVTDLDPNRAAAMSNAYVEELDLQNKRLAGGQASSKRVFLENRLKEIQEELSRIDSLQSRQAQIKEMLFELLAKECEIAKMEEAKNMPTIQVLDCAVIPERPEGRGTVKKVMTAGIAGVLLGIFLAFVREHMKSLRAKQEDPVKGAIC